MIFSTAKVYNFYLDLGKIVNFFVVLEHYVPSKAEKTGTFVNIWLG